MDTAPTDHRLASETIRAQQMAWVERLAEEFGLDAKTLASPQLYPNEAVLATMAELKKLSASSGAKLLYRFSEDTEASPKYISFRSEVPPLIDAMYDEYLLAWHWRKLANEDVHSTDMQQEKRLAIIDAIEAKIPEHFLAAILEVLPPGPRAEREAAAIVGAATRRFVVAMNVSEGMGVDLEKGYSIEPQIKKRLQPEERTPGNIISEIRGHAKQTDSIATEILKR